MDLVDEEEAARVSCNEMIPTAPGEQENLYNSLDFTEGRSGQAFGQMLAYASRKEGIKKRAKDLVDIDGRQRKDMIEQAKKITSGVLIKAGIHSCNDPILVEVLKQRDEQRKQDAAEKKKKEKERISALRKKVNEIRKKKGMRTQSWNQSECKAFLQYKKRKTGDPKMPQSLLELQQRCKEWTSRQSPLNSDDESDDGVI